MDHDTDCEPDQRLAALGPRRMPRSHGMEVVRNSADEQTLVEVDPRHLDPLIAHVELEAEEPEVEARGEDAYIAVEPLAAFQYEAGFGKALDLGCPDGDPPGAQHVLQADRYGDPLLP